MIGILLLLATPSVGVTPSTAAPEEIRIHAEEAYHAGLEARADAEKARPLFRKSADSYEQLWRLGIRNRHVARNMAQAYYLAGDLGRSIRAYHLGLRLAPHDRDLQAGLTFARGQVQYPLTGNLAESCRPRERTFLFNVGPADTLKTVAAVFYLFGFLTFARAWLTRRTLEWALGGLLLAAACIVVCGLKWEDARRADDNRLPLIVTVDIGTPLHRGNGTEFPLRFADRLPAGVEARVLAERGGWLQVQLAGGEIGWLERERVVAVE